MLEEIAPIGLHEWLLPRVLSLEGIGPDSRVLDFGCGTGAWLERLYACNFRALTGIDRRADDFSATSKAHFICCDLDQPVTAELGTYDLITAIEIIEHVANPEALVALADSHLAPNGWLVITTPNIYSIGTRFRFLVTSELLTFEGDKYCNPEHIHPFLLEAFKRVILPRYRLRLEKTVGYVRADEGARWRRFTKRGLAMVFGESVRGESLCIFLRKNCIQR